MRKDCKEYPKLAGKDSRRVDGKRIRLIIGIIGLFIAMASVSLGISSKTETLVVFLVFAGLPFEGGSCQRKTRVSYPPNWLEVRWIQKVTPMMRL